jgi:hypothetical protein
LSFGFGYETNIAGIGAPPNFHVMAENTGQKSVKFGVILTRITVLAEMQIFSIYSICFWAIVRLSDVQKTDI